MGGFPESWSASKRFWGAWAGRSVGLAGLAGFSLFLGTVLPRLTVLGDELLRLGCFFHFSFLLLLLAAFPDQNDPAGVVSQNFFKEFIPH